MRAIRELEQAGYTFTVDGDQVRATHSGDIADADQARALLQFVKRHRDDALVYLCKREQIESRLEHGLEVLAAATGCDDAEAERLLGRWDKLGLEYDAAVARG